MKLTLTDAKSGYNLTPLNTNFEAIEQELQNSVDSGSGMTFFAGNVGREASFRSTDDTILLFEYNTDTGAFVANRAIVEIFKV